MKAFTIFSENNFVPDTEDKEKLLQSVVGHRREVGIVPRFRILRQLAKVRPFVKTVYPEGWKFQ